jgi:hypothetical protein
MPLELPAGQLIDMGRSYAPYHNKINNIAYSLMIGRRQRVAALHTLFFLFIGVPMSALL